MKSCSTSLIMMKMQIKMTVRYHLIPFKMSIIRKTRNNKLWGRCGENGSLLHCQQRCKWVQPLRKTVWRFLKKIKNRTIIWSSNSNFGYLSKENENTNSKRHMYPSMFTGALFPIPKIWKQPVSTGGWMDREYAVCKHNNWGLLSHKRERNIATCDNMDRYAGHYARWNNWDRERQIPYDLTYTWNLKTATVAKKTKPIGAQRTDWWGVRDKIKVRDWRTLLWDIRVKRYKLLLTVIK